MDIKGHAAIVTGGGSGLGAATAAELAKAGAKVALLDVNMDAANAHARKNRRHRDQMRCVGCGQRRSRHQGGERQERRRRAS